MSAPTYEIRTVEDFLDVPAEKVAHCLTDFALWIALHREFRETFGGLEGVHMKADAFQWIDDGQHDAHFNIVVRGKTP